MGRDRRQRRRRVAALGGAAVAAKKHRDNKLAAEEPEQASAPQAEPTDPAPAAPGGITADTTERLKELGELHEQGVLTDEEFAARRRRCWESDTPTTRTRPRRRWFRGQFFSHAIGSGVTACRCHDPTHAPGGGGGSLRARSIRIRGDTATNPVALNRPLAPRSAIGGPPCAGGGGGTRLAAAVHEPLALASVRANRQPPERPDDTRSGRQPQTQPTPRSRRFLGEIAGRGVLCNALGGGPERPLWQETAPAAVSATSEGRAVTHRQRSAPSARIGTSTSDPHGTRRTRRSDSRLRNHRRRCPTVSPASSSCHLPPGCQSSGPTRSSGLRDESNSRPLPPSRRGISGRPPSFGALATMHRGRRSSVGDLDLAENPGEGDAGLSSLGDRLVEAAVNRDPALGDIGLEAVKVIRLASGELEQPALSLVPLEVRSKRPGDRVDAGSNGHSRVGIGSLCA